MLRIFSIIAVVAAVGATAVVAQTDAMTARNEAMKAQGQQLYGVINGMVKGDAPYDQAKVDAAFTIIEDITKKAAPLYDVKSDQPAPNSRFKPTAKIWENKKDFDDRFVVVAKVVAESKPKVKSLDDLKVAFTAVNNACTGCHEQYRARN